MTARDPREPGSLVSSASNQDQGVRGPASGGQVAAEPPDPDRVQDAEAGVERRDDPGQEPRGLPGRELQRQLGQVPVDQQVARRRDRHCGLQHFPRAGRWRP